MYPILLELVIVILSILVTVSGILVKITILPFATASKSSRELNLVATFVASSSGVELPTKFPSLSVCGPIENCILVGVLKK